MSTSEENWQKTIGFASRQPNSVVGFGVHPWFAPGVSSRWLEQLEQLLLHHPNAFCGEAGLDKVAKWRDSGIVEFDRQLDVFKQQLLLATKLSRPMSVHCVHAHGQLVDLLRAQKALPPLIALHSFSGKAPLVETYLSVKSLRDRLYFGFSYVINARAEQRTLECLKVIPDDRLLLESDVEDLQDVDDLMRKMIELIMQAKEWSFERTVQTTNENAKRFFASYIAKEAKENVSDIIRNNDNNDNDSAHNETSSTHRCCSTRNNNDDEED